MHRRRIEKGEAPVRFYGRIAWCDFGARRALQVFGGAAFASRGPTACDMREQNASGGGEGSTAIQWICDVAQYSQPFRWTLT
jgi:hypothetical protein